MDMRLLCIAGVVAFCTAPAPAKPLENETPGPLRGSIVEQPGDDASGPAGCRQRRDGKLMRERALKRFDADGNGTLDDAEKAEARKAARSSIRHHRRMLLKRFDADGDGALDESERAAAREARRAKLLQRFDANGDGRIDEDERAAIRDALKERRAHRREHRRGDDDGAMPPREPLEPEAGPPVLPVSEI